MDDEDRAKLYAAMYDPQDEEKPVGKRKPDEVIDTLGGLRKTRRMVMGAVGYEIPTVEYVDSLEKRIIRQDDVIQDQNRRLKRLEIMLGSLQSAVRKNSTLVSDVRNGLDNKIDRRDLS